MSGLVVGWAFSRRGLTPTQKLTLIALADCADERGGNCYPSQTLIAEKTGLSERTVRAALSELEEQQLITREHRALGEGRGRRSDLYALAVGGLREHIERFDQPAAHDDQPANDVRTNRQPAHDQPATRAASSETSEEPSEQQQQRDAHASESTGHPLVDETLAKLRGAGLFIDRFAIENVLVRYVDRPHLVEDALAEVVALAGDPAYRQPKGGAAMMLLRQIRQQGAPPRRTYGNRPQLAPADLPDEFAIYNTGLVA